MNYKISTTLKSLPSVQAARLLLLSLERESKSRIVLVSNNNFARQLYDELCVILKLSSFTSIDELLSLPVCPILLPALEFSPFLEVKGDSSNLAERILARHIWVDRSNNFKMNTNLLIVPVQVCFEKLEEFNSFTKRQLILEKGTNISQKDLVYKLSDYGYNRIGRVVEVGQFSEHAMVVDVYSPLYADCLRVEIRNDIIFSLRAIDVSSQRSSYSLDRIRIPVNHECHIEEEQAAFLEERMIPHLRELADIKNFPSSSLRLMEERLISGNLFNGCELFISQILKDNFSILDLATEDTKLDILIPELIDRDLDNLAAMLKRDLDGAERRGGLVPFFERTYFSVEEIRDKLSQLSEYVPLNNDNINLIEEFSLLKESVSKNKIINGPLEKVLNLILEYQKQNYKILFFLNSLNRRELIESFFNNNSINYRIVEDSVFKFLKKDSDKSGVYIFNTPCPRSLLCKNLKLLFISEQEIFGVRTVKVRRLPYKQSNFRVKVGNLGQLKIGEAVVHEQYGIGIFHGLKKIFKGDISGEYLDIEYGEGSRLYVPIHDFTKVGRYQSSEVTPPALTILGSGKWEASKQKIKNEIASLTGNLLKTHAARTLINGFDFGESTLEQRLFAESFEYVETEDQAKAILDVEIDMNSSKPMDRLVCGDVGFGKTEVALRAAFKAVQAGKQVALLAPTTLLIDQHYKTFTDRFKMFPYRVGVINRFRSKTEIEKILNDLKNGTLDIILGTHRLLQKDVAFKDLGLIIVDEEQKFGVAQKERLKRFRVEVDVLTLSATPIPRTLQQALHGTRDLSVIETAPFGRQPIATKVSQFTKDTLLEALDHELARGGQVYIVQHLIQGLNDVLEMVRELRPDVVSEVAHGRMKGAELEDIMARFYDGSIRILISTAIVESGLDVSNANTLIILNPQDFGLAQLYQLRGRVGRGERRATAYFLYESYARLTDDAKRRLAVLESHDSLGNGFRLALQDMELRGAGSLFGKDQSGHAQAVGYDMYFKILEEAVSLEKSRRGVLEDIYKVKDYSYLEPDILLGVNLIISEEIIPDMHERLLLYQRALEIKSIRGLEDFCEEFIDRFGVISEGVENFLLHMLIRNMCIDMGIARIVRVEERVRMSFVEDNIYLAKAKELVTLAKVISFLQIEVLIDSIKDLPLKLQRFY